MKMIFGIFVFVSIFAMASATKKGDDTLVSVLSRERKEMKDMFREETKQLRQENTKIRQEDDKLRRQIVKMREEKLQDENAQLKKEIQKLRHADRRQRDQIDSFAKKLKESSKCECQTGNSSQTEAIAEVAFINGSAHATSKVSSSSGPAKAFIFGNYKAYWQSNGDSNVLYGAYPKMIWYDFSIGNGFVPARITFQGSQQSSAYTMYTPSIWEFVGSNDDVCSKSSDWTILCRDYSNVQPQNIYAIKRCDVEGRANKKFRCLGINILSTHTGYSMVSNIRMWQKV